MISTDEHSDSTLELVVHVSWSVDDGCYSWDVWIVCFGIDVPVAPHDDSVPEFQTCQHLLSFINCQHHPFDWCSFVSVCPILKSYFAVECSFIISVVSPGKMHISCTVKWAELAFLTLLEVVYCWKQQQAHFTALNPGQPGWSGSRNVHDSYPSLCLTNWCWAMLLDLCLPFTTIHCITTDVVKKMICRLIFLFRWQQCISLY